jgi:hypothetical protein
MSAKPEHERGQIHHALEGQCCLVVAGGNGLALLKPGRGLTRLLAGGALFSSHRSGGGRTAGRRVWRNVGQQVIGSCYVWYGVAVPTAYDQNPGYTRTG